MSPPRPAPSTEVRALYEASYDRLVRVVGAACGDVHEAEEAVQEAFVRLLGVWSRVASYDDPEGWVRHVALRQVSNRRRKVRNGLLALARLAPSDPVASPSPAPVDLDRALAQLPRPQRVVVVLHLLGLSATEVAAELGVPEGTVKSRLARARAALAALLEECDARA